MALLETRKLDNDLELDLTLEIVDGQDIVDTYCAFDDDVSSCMTEQEACVSFYLYVKDLRMIRIIQHQPNGPDILQLRALLWRAADDITGQVVHIVDNRYININYLYSIREIFDQLTQDYGIKSTNKHSVELLPDAEKCEVFPYVDRFIYMNEENTKLQTYSDGMSWVLRSENGGYIDIDDF